MAIGSSTLAVFLLLAVIGPWVAPYNPAQTFSTTASFPQPPSLAHLLGTTQQQQDVLSQLLAGGRSTVLVAFVAGLVATVLSVVIGVTAGYAGGVADDLLSMLATAARIRAPRARATKRRTSPCRRPGPWPRCWAGSRSRSRSRGCALAWPRRRRAGR